MVAGEGILRAPTPPKNPDSAARGGILMPSYTRDRLADRLFVIHVLHTLHNLHLHHKSFPMSSRGSGYAQGREPPLTCSSTLNATS
jgi:hypothetical protein